MKFDTEDQPFRPRSSHVFFGRCVTERQRELTRKKPWLAPKTPANEQSEAKEKPRGPEPAP